MKKLATSPDPLEKNRLSPEIFGKRLKASRKRSGWTLVKLAETSGVSIATISRAERGQLALGYENLAALVKALGMDLDSMFAADGEQRSFRMQPVMTRAGEGVSYKGQSFYYEFLGTSVKGKKFQPIVGTVHARAINDSSDFARHPGEEFVYVLSGAVDVHFENGEVFSLVKGDSLYYDSMVGHAFVSTSRQLAKVLGVNTSESDHVSSAIQNGEK